MKAYGRYNFKNQPERLIYIGKSGPWHQFYLVGKLDRVWAEVLDRDLDMIEETVDSDK